MVQSDLQQLHGRGTADDLVLQAHRHQVIQLHAAHGHGMAAQSCMRSVH